MIIKAPKIGIYIIILCFGLSNIALADDIERSQLEVQLKTKQADRNTLQKERENRGNYLTRLFNKIEDDDAMYEQLHSDARPYGKNLDTARKAYRDNFMAQQQAKLDAGNAVAKAYQHTKYALKAVPIRMKIAYNEKKYNEIMDKAGTYVYRLSDLRHQYAVAEEKMENLKYKIEEFDEDILKIQYELRAMDKKESEDETSTKKSERDKTKTKGLYGYDQGANTLITKTKEFIKEQSKTEQDKDKKKEPPKFVNQGKKKKDNDKPKFVAKGKTGDPGTKPPPKFVDKGKKDDTSQTSTGQASDKEGDFRIVSLNVNYETINYNGRSLRKVTNPNSTLIIIRRNGKEQIVEGQEAINKLIQKGLLGNFPGVGLIATTKFDDFGGYSDNYFKHTGQDSGLAKGDECGAKLQECYRKCGPYMQSAAKKKTSQMSADEFWCRLCTQLAERCKNKTKSTRRDDFDKGFKRSQMSPEAAKVFGGGVAPAENRINDKMIKFKANDKDAELYGGAAGPQSKGD